MTQTIRKSASEHDRVRNYDRGLLRSMFVSLFWTVIMSRRTRAKYKLQQLADTVRTDKSEVSRWFSGNAPNWQLNTVSDVAQALDLELEIRARERSTGKIFSPHGEIYEVRAELISSRTRDTLPRIGTKPLASRPIIFGATAQNSSVPHSRALVPVGNK